MSALNPPRGAVAAIGNFDGVHRGHQMLLAEAKRHADAMCAPLGVVVFDPHPRRYFRPEDPSFLLTASDVRDGLLRDCGVDAIFALTFDDALSLLTPETFVKDILSDQLGLAGVVTGAEFRFGAKRAGDVEALRRLGEASDITAYTVDLLSDAGNAEKIGSSLVRTMLREGDAARAAHLLGRRWSVSGIVQPGQKLGRTIGFPTANITLGDLIEPRYGVYCVTVAAAGKLYEGVANFGRRPTVGAPAPLLEAHLFDFHGDLYGQEITVSFADFIRSEIKFDGVDALKDQIAKDCDTARAFFISEKAL